MARVLIVDDDPEVRELLVGVVARAGHQVIEAADSLHAWDALHQDPQAILIDIDMPGESGTDMVARARLNPRWQNTPVVFVTAFRERAEAALQNDPAVVDIIAKPFRLDQVMRRLHRIVDPPRMAAAAF